MGRGGEGVTERRRKTKEDKRRQKKRERERIPKPDWFDLTVMVAPSRSFESPNILIWRLV